MTALTLEADFTGSRCDVSDVPLADIRSGVRPWRLRFRLTKRYGILRRSLRLDAREFHHLGPLLGFLGDELAEVGRRTDKRCASETGESRLDIGIGKSRVDFLVELVDDVSRRVLGRAEAVPEIRFVARHKLTDSRHVG